MSGGSQPAPRGVRLVGCIHCVIDTLPKGKPDKVTGINNIMLDSLFNLDYYYLSAAITQPVNKKVEMKMKLTTSLALIRVHSYHLYGKLLNSLGGAEAYGENTPINLLTILKSNGVADMLWCLRATHQDATAISRTLAIEFAEEVLPIFEARFPNDARPRKAIQAAKDFMAGKIDAAALQMARKAASADYTAAYVASVAAAHHMMREKQAEIIRKYLSED